MKLNQHPQSDRRDMRNMRSRNSTLGATAISAVEEAEVPECELERPRAETRSASGSRAGGRSAFRNWPRIRERLRAAKHWAFFLDFDGTLVNLRRRPGDVRMPREARIVLKHLAAHLNVRVVIVSGRPLRDVRELISVKGLRYFGVHGGEREDKPVALSLGSRRALEAVKRSARRKLEDIPGVWLEDKGLSLAVHYRDADQAAAESAGTTLASLIRPSRNALHILNGSRVWEVLPQEIPGKYTAVNDVLAQLPTGTVVVYIGNDGTDEVAFAELPDQITVRVGRATGSRARYSVRTPAEVLRLLARMEKELP
jgi:trehalose 6-phosphate phosphatase